MVRTTAAVALTICPPHSVCAKLDSYGTSQQTVPRWRALERLKVVGKGSGSRLTRNYMTNEAITYVNEVTAISRVVGDVSEG